MATTHFSGPIALGSDSIEVIGAAKTLTAADNGKTFILTTSGTDGATIVLPLHASGLRFKFIIGAVFATTDWIIDHPVGEDDTMEGNLMVLSTVVNVDAAKAINFGAGAENIGDWVTVLSDGAIWYVAGSGLNSVGITVTA